MSIYYPLPKEEIEIEISGTNRMAVDGVTATCQRIKRILEKPFDPSAESVRAIASGGALGTHQASSSETPADATLAGAVVTTPTPSPSWLKQTWKTHTFNFLIALVSGVLVLAAALWLGLSPRP